MKNPDPESKPPGTVNPGTAGLRTRATPTDTSTEPDHPVTPGNGTRATPPSASTEPRDPREHPRNNSPRGWHSRNYIPHFDSNDVMQHVTFHLADSLPKEALQVLEAEIEELDPDRQDIKRRRRLEALVDAGHGACWLRRPDCACIVQDSLLHFDGERYRIIAWTIMPNHVHVLFQTINGWSMDPIVGSWKTYTANAIGQLIRKPGQPMPHVWRYIRDEQHLTNVIAYIHNNPVKARLVTHPEQWPWSSANPGHSTPATPPDTGAEPAPPGTAGLRTRATPPADASAEPRDPRKNPRNQP